MKNNFFVIEVNRGDGPTNEFLKLTENPRDKNLIVAHPSEATSFSSHEDAMAVYRLLGFTLKDFKVIEVFKVRKRVENTPFNRILKYFKYDHLPKNLQEISMPFCDLAHEIASRGSEQNIAETFDCLRNLLRAKDSAVRASL